jgi:hypothetical protein
VGFHRGLLPAPFAPSRQEPGDQFLAAGGGRDWLAVVEDRFVLPPERDAAEPGDQWFPALSFDAGLSLEDIK